MGSSNGSANIAGDMDALRTARGQELTRAFARYAGLSAEEAQDIEDLALALDRELDFTGRSSSAAASAGSMRLAPKGLGEALQAHRLRLVFTSLLAAYQLGRHNLNAALLEGLPFSEQDSFDRG